MCTVTTFNWVPKQELRQKPSCSGWENKVEVRDRQNSVAHGSQDPCQATCMPDRKKDSCAEPTGKTAFKGESVQEVGGVGLICIEMWLMDECVW